MSSSSVKRILDLFCGAGGAAMGYHRVFPDAEIVGVDVWGQPNYPFTFVQEDAMFFPLEGFDLIHASPPCQVHSRLRALHPERIHLDFIPETRKRLQESSTWYVIENVIGAPLKAPVTLCGSSFDLDVMRHRLFEANFPIFQPSCEHDRPRKYRITNSRDSWWTAFVPVYGNGGYGEGRRFWDVAMDIDWMTREELTQAIPPAYTECVGKSLALFLDRIAAFRT